MHVLASPLNFWLKRKFWSFYNSLHDKSWNKDLKKKKGWNAGESIVYCWQRPSAPSLILDMWCCLSQEQIWEIPDKRYSFCWYALTVSFNICFSPLPLVWALFGQDCLLKKLSLIFEMTHSSSAYSLVPGI